MHISLHGPAALDVSHLFCERWNFIKELKYSKSKEYPILAFPHGAPSLDEVDPRHDAVARHPSTVHFHKAGQVFRHPWHAEHRVQQPPDGVNSTDAIMDVQVIRSCGDWSNGTLTETSIQNAYIEMIREANHCIYIENQFFITATEPGTKVSNMIGAAIVERILSAARDKKKFKIVVVIPTVPCFAGDLDEAAGIRCIMAWQYRSISRRGKSIMEQVEAAGVNPHDYISFYNLRGIDRINLSRVRKMEKDSGIPFHHAQVAAARLFVGKEGYVGGKQKISIRVGDDPQLGNSKLKEGSMVEAVPLPQTEEEAIEILKKFGECSVLFQGSCDVLRKSIDHRFGWHPTTEAAAPREEVPCKDSIAENVFHGQSAIKDEPWSGDNEAEEKNAFVTEEVYVHSKLMIIDDRRVSHAL